MKLKLLIGLIVTTLFITLILIKLNFQKHSQIEYNKSVINQGASPMTHKDPFASARYEFMRLRDPKTGKIPPGIMSREINFVRSLNRSISKSGSRILNNESSGRFGWKSRGPFNIGGRTREIGIDIRDENILIAGCVSGGIWKSEDNGQSWRKVTKPYQLHTITCLVQDIRPGKENTWYAGTGETSGGHDQARDLVPFRGNGIFKSEDNGENWELLDATTSDQSEITDHPFTWVHRLQINYANFNENEIYAATRRGIHRSVDSGSTWELVLGGTTNCWDAEINVTSTGVKYASLSWGTSRGLWRSIDGVEWTNITPSNWPARYYRVLIAAAPSNENIVYFLSDITDITGFDWTSNPEGPSTEQVLWKYTYHIGDGSGAKGTWEDLSANLPSNYQSNLSYCMALSVLPTDENIVFVGGRMLYRSTNGFTNSTTNQEIGGHFYNHPKSHVDQHKIIFSYNSSLTAYAATDGGVHKTNDITAQVVQWEELNNGYITTQFYTTSVMQSGINDKRILAGSHDHGVFYVDSDEPDAAWDLINYSDGGFTAILSNRLGFIFNNHTAGNTFMLSDIPGNMYEDAPPLGYIPNDYVFTKINPNISNPLFVNPFVTDPNNNRKIFMAGGDGLYYCENVTAIPLDRTQTTKNAYWRKISSTNGAALTAIGISKTITDRIYFGSSEGEIYRLDNASIDSPYRIDVYTAKEFPNGAYVSNIAVDPNNADHAVVSFSNFNVQSIFATWDAGNTWIHMSGNLEEFSDGSGAGPAVNWVAILPITGTNIYLAGTTTGLYSTNDLENGNVVWEQEGPETIGNVNVKHVTTREADGEIVISTYGNGIYSRDFSVASVGVEQIIESRYKLMQNYPNPFNPETTIEFYIPEADNINLIVYDLLGREVIKLMNGEIPSGLHSVVFSGSGLSSGIYFYKLETNKFIDTKKFLLLK